MLMLKRWLNSYLLIACQVLAAAEGAAAAAGADQAAEVVYIGPDGTRWTPAPAPFFNATPRDRQRAIRRTLGGLSATATQRSTAETAVTAKLATDLLAAAELSALAAEAVAVAGAAETKDN
ncbi:MAG TPA: hypothetical protein VJJ83_02225 [Candidatus Babeliales bacterium]|nr:hypothetical protein [Candidatus Babeliales bacterium]